MLCDSGLLNNVFAKHYELNYVTLKENYMNIPWLKGKRPILR